MDFFKKRSTAWAVLVITIVLCSFWGIKKRPSDTKDIELLPSRRLRTGQGKHFKR